MAIDLMTFSIMSIFLQVLCGSLFIFSSFYYRDEPAGFWWGASFLVLAAGVALSTFGSLSDSDAILALAFIVFIVCASSQWVGTRLLTGAPMRPYLAIAGPIIITLVNFLPVGEALPIVRGMTAAVLNIAYFGASIYTLLRPASQRLTAFKPLAALFALNTVAIALAPFGGLGSKEGSAPQLFSIIGFLNVEAWVFVVGTTMFVIAAMRERKELTSNNAASTDPLTDLPNRRAFFECGERNLQRCTKDEKPCSVVMIDLDKFKSVNDRFGHAAGDNVLIVFAETAMQTLRPGDCVARFGGEEFAAVLPNTDTEQAVAVTERLRKAFEVAGMYVDGQKVGATLSAGVATSFPGSTLENLIRDADDALYAAKNNGRNRVESQGESALSRSTGVSQIA